MNSDLLARLIKEERQLLADYEKTTQNALPDLLEEIAKLRGLLESSASLITKHHAAGEVIAGRVCLYCSTGIHGGKVHWVPQRQAIEDELAKMQR